MEKVELGWNDFWAEMFRVKHRRSIQGITHYDRLVVDFCIEALGLKKGGEILDIACGAGDQSIEFAKRKLKVSAFDISDRLIEVAKDQAKADGVSVNFFKGDMRNMKFDRQFDAAVLLSHSFGFFNHEVNKRVLRASYDSLKPKGKLMLDLMNPYSLPRFQQTWTKLEGGYLLSEPHVLDAPAGVLRGRPAIFIDMEGDRIVLMNEDAIENNDIRMYTALEIKSMLEEVGFKKVELYGENQLPRVQYCATSERMVVIASRL
jgi:2-polyprenyl-3-methyl-5-hydroxy-6-metoxy-1,4-benzoquinol methylase